MTASDRALNTALAREGTGRAYAAVLAEGSRLHRQGNVPLVGRNAIVAWLERMGSPASGPLAESASAGVAASGDLGYSYGLYESRSSGVERGAYLRIWARDAAARWWLVADVTEP